jgi:hypothetical protein
MPRASSCLAVRGEAAPGVFSSTWCSYPPHGPSTESFSIFMRVLFFDLIFEAAFAGLLVLKMGHTAYLRKARDIYFPTV